MFWWNLDKCYWVSVLWHHSFQFKTSLLWWSCKGLLICATLMLAIWDSLWCFSIVRLICSFAAVHVPGQFHIDHGQQDLLQRGVVPFMADMQATLKGWRDKEKISASRLNEWFNDSIFNLEHSKRQKYVAVPCGRIQDERASYSEFLPALMGQAAGGIWSHTETGGEWHLLCIFSEERKVYRPMFT